MSQKDFMGAEDAEWMAPSLKHSTSTDTIISSYELKISQGIASKILAATRKNKAPEFTKEELLYLNKQADEVDDTELKVITPTPAITLKKGKTELNIGHAAVLVQKMEEKYPTPKSTTLVDDIEKANTQWKQAKIYKDGEYQTTIENSQYIPPTSNFQQMAGIVPVETKTVNKNAYEIREAILSHALDWVKYTHELRTERTVPSEDEVLNVAHKFYKFVENKK